MKSSTNKSSDPQPAMSIKHANTRWRCLKYVWKPRIQILLLATIVLCCYWTSFRQWSNKAKHRQERDSASLLAVESTSTDEKKQIAVSSKLRRSTAPGLGNSSQILSSSSYVAWPEEATIALATYKEPPNMDHLFDSPLMTSEFIQVDADINRQPVLDQMALSNGTGLLNNSIEGIGHYTHSFMQLIEKLPHTYMNRSLLIRYGDSTEKAIYPLLAKCRVIGDEKVVLLPLNMGRHFNAAFREIINKGHDQRSLGEKEKKVLWRGVTTGQGWDPSKESPKNHRRALLERWGDHLFSSYVDVGINGFCQEVSGDFHDRIRRHWQKYYRPAISWQEMLQFRYLISVEGNDVASNLKWLLASNSVVFMPLPRRESWAMESQLKPWIHFVPLKPDFSDLLERVEQCEHHLQKCQAIARRATEYVSYFNETSRIIEQGASRLKDYLDKITIHIKSSS